jgi:hypothetical protein
VNLRAGIPLLVIIHVFVNDKEITSKDRRCNAMQDVWDVSKIDKGNEIDAKAGLDGYRLDWARPKISI